MSEPTRSEQQPSVAQSHQHAAGRRRALLAVAGSQLLVLTLWFSASAAAPQLEADWGLTSGETAGLTLAVQIGFVIGALASALLAIADIVPARRLFVFSALAGAGANALLLGLGPGDVPIAFGLRLLTGVALAGVYPSGLKVMTGWFRRDRGMALVRSSRRREKTAHRSGSAGSVSTTSGTPATVSFTGPTSRRPGME